jgi:hypothetical protein
VSGEALEARIEAAEGNGEYGRNTHCTRNPLVSLGRPYDIREIDGDLYEAVLACRIQQDAGAAADLS